MPANFGVNINISNAAASPIKIQSQTPIGIAAAIKGASKEAIYALAGYNSTEENPIFAFSNVSKAKEFVSTLIKEQNLQDYRLLDMLECIALQNVTCVIIVSFFLEEKESENNTAGCIEALDLFRKARARTGFAPDLIIAPYYSSEAGVKEKIQSLCEGLKITGIVDLYAQNVGEAINAMESFSTKRLIATFPQVQILNSRGAYAFVPQSPFVAAMIAYGDGEVEYGFSNSYSNRVVSGITGVEHFIDFVMGEDCDADRLRSNQISTIILSEGYRTWGGDTSDEETIWQDLARVRTFDRIALAAQKASFKAIDKKASELYFIKLSVEEMLRNLKGAKVLIGYEVEWDEEQNTPSNISAGKFYLQIKMMNNPIVKQLTLDFKYSDEWAGELLKSLQAE
ncbi:phage tail sheath family protein [Helicobacter winghamensis]|uniref:phage tail sheath family protein n=1 Tax=Helicobacter winghamensis TaxID=157268 RepID=UPI0027A45165